MSDKEFKFNYELYDDGLTVDQLKSISKNLLETDATIIGAGLLVAKILGLAIIQKMIHNKADKQYDKAKQEWRIQAANDSNNNVNV